MSSAAIVIGAYAAAGIPQPLLRSRENMRAPARMLGAGIEAASIGARRGTFIRRVPMPGIDLDIHADYAVCNTLSGAQDFLTRVARSNHVASAASLQRLRSVVTTFVGGDPLRNPKAWRSLAFLAKVHPSEDVLTAPVSLFETRATVTAPIGKGSAPFWVTGFDLAAAALEPTGRGEVPQFSEAWTFDIGAFLPGLHSVPLPGGYEWDPRRLLTYQSRGGMRRGSLPLLFAAMRAELSTSDLPAATIIRRRGMLKTATNVCAFGLYSASYNTTSKSPPGSRVLTSEGTASASAAAEQAGPYAFPPGAALVQGAGRLLLCLLLREINLRGGSVVQADTDGCFVVATPGGGEIEVPGGDVVSALSHDEVQDVRERFAEMARFAGLPITPNSIAQPESQRRAARPSLLRVESTMFTPGGDLGEYLNYAVGPGRFAIHPKHSRGDWRPSEATIGTMVNPTSLSGMAFAKECYRYLLARERGQDFDAAWLDEPVLWPKSITRPEDLVAARRAIQDLRPMESVAYAHALFGEARFLARWEAGSSWRGVTWHAEDGLVADLVSGGTRAVGAVRTWRTFLSGFLTRAVPFCLDANGVRATGATVGPLQPRPILVRSIVRTGRTDWTGEDGAGAPEAWETVLAELEGISSKDLRGAGLADRTVRAMRTGRKPTRRNADLARALVARRARAKAGRVRGDQLICRASDCVAPLSGRQRSFCARHAAYSGSRRKAWMEAGT